MSKIKGMNYVSQMLVALRSLFRFPNKEIGKRELSVAGPNIQVSVEQHQKQHQTQQ